MQIQVMQYTGQPMALHSPTEQQVVGTCQDILQCANKARGEKVNEDDGEIMLDIK